MTTEHTRGRLLSGKSGSGRRAKRRRSQFPEPVRNGSRSTRVTPAISLDQAGAELVELVESALQDTTSLEPARSDDLLSTVPS